MIDRELAWDGCFNVRDLGGIHTADGRVTRRGVLIRADAPSGLTEAGWVALRECGVTTVIDLTETHEQRPDAAPRPAGLTTVHVPLDGTDEDFWAPRKANGHWATSLYYRAFLDRYPDRVAAAVRAFAVAPPGGVVVHCGRGRDRTGLISLMLLSLAGASATDIIDDYQRSDSPRVVELRLGLGLPDDTTATAQIYRDGGTTEIDTLRRLLDGFESADVLRAGGLSDGDAHTARERLLGLASG